MYWLRLIRWQNLIIVALTQLLIWLCVIRPVQAMSNAAPLLTPLHFLLLMLSTVFIAAAGYIINDYFDIRIDAINRPQKMVLEQRVPRRVGIILHNLLNGLALLMVFFVLRRGGSYWWILWQLACIILLWFYSTHFKRRFVIGNVVVALLTALTIVVLAVYEPILNPYFSASSFIKNLEGDRLPNPIWLLSVYAFFAFILTWMREIVKDMEDFKGDEADGCVTMPIQWGLQRASFFTMALGVLALIPLVIVSIALLWQQDWALGGYTIAAIIVPLVWLVITLPKKATTAHYANMSRWLKIIMVSGIGSLIIYYFEANG